MFRTLLFSFLIALVGCETPTPTDPGNPGDTGLTYYSDIAPMVDQYCVRCHAPGGPGGLDLTDPEVVDLYAEVMLDRIDAGEMPPPVSDPDCRPYQASEDLNLPMEKRDLLANWISEGKAAGNPADRPVFDSSLPELTDANLEVRLPTPYTPVFEDPSNPGNEYRCFYLEHGREEGFYVTGFAPLIDQQDLVHHIVMYKVSESSVPEGYDPAVGKDCINETGAIAYGMISGWAPGALPVIFPEGYGMYIAPDERIVMQMHYFQGDGVPGDRTDQTGYAFRTSNSVETEMRMFPYGGTSFEIPAGDEAYEWTASNRLPETIELGGVDVPFPGLKVHATFPHMHLLGSAYRLWVDRPDDEQVCLVDSQSYDFDNQLTYYFDEPLEVAPGDRINFSCTWNNSASNPDLLTTPQDTRYGERTDEEMCWAFTLVSIEW